MKLSNKARDELEKVRVAIEKMRNASSLDSYEDAWESYLIRLERVWNKLCSHFSRSPKYKTCQIIERARQFRNDDPLLSYLVNARGVSEHTIEEITERESGGIGISPAIGNELYVEHMTIKIQNGNINIKSKSKPPIKIHFIPAKLKLKSVKNRSGIYHPPKLHLGKALPSIEPLHVAEAGLFFYDNLLKQAEEYFAD